MKKISLLKIGFALILCGIIAASCGKGSSDEDEPNPTPANPNTPGGNTTPGGEQETTENNLTFDANGATGTIQPIKYKDDTTIPDASSLTYADHAFLGWSTDKNAKTAEYNTGDQYKGKSATLYAIWTQIYKITYHYDPKVPETKNETTYTAADYDKGTVKIHYDITIAANQQLTWTDTSGNTYKDGDKPASASNLELWAEITSQINGATTSEEWTTKEYKYPNN